MNIRVIPRLDIKGPNLVKGIHLEGLRVLGRPEDFARKYYEQGADELVYIDLVASLYGRSNLKEIISRTAGHIFIPLTVGGGVRSVEDMRELLRAGADKIAINTALFTDPTLLEKGANVFGSQCMVLYVEAKRMPDGRYLCMHTNARENSGREVVDWVREAVSRGAGEVLLTSEDREGTGLGYDLELLRKVNDAVEVPIIASGGVGNVGHLIEGAAVLGAGAVSAASIFHYHSLVEITDTRRFESEGNTAFIELSRSHTSAYLEGRIKSAGIGEAKSVLAAAGFNLRVGTQEPIKGLTGMAPDVVIVDYGMGNLFSLSRAIQRLTGKEATITNDPSVVRSASKVILPGVGAFGDAMANLRECGLVQSLRDRAAHGLPLLGICLGMQLLLSRSYEFGVHEGLDIIPGEVRHLFDKGCHAGTPVPHIGWAGLRIPCQNDWQNTPFASLVDCCPAYFVHSFAARPQYAEDVLSLTEYGPATFVSAVLRGNVCGCQFHPELSGPGGLSILANFLKTR